MLNLPNLSDTLNAISSRVSEDGVTRSDSQDGPIALQFGQALAPANLSARQAKAADLLTSGIYGPPSFISLRSTNLQQSLGNKLQAKMGSNGSPLFKMTWKLRDIPQRQSIYALRASGLRTSGKDSSGWPTTSASDGNGGRTPKDLLKKIRPSGAKVSQTLNASALLAHWPTPRGPHGSGPSDGTTRGITPEGAALLASWITPRATDGSNGGPNQAGGALSAQASWAIPEDAVSQILGRTQALSSVPMEKRGQLNPLFSLWLMGYPIEWGYCGVLVTLSSRKSRRKS